MPLTGREDEQGDVRGSPYSVSVPCSSTDVMAAAGSVTFTVSYVVAPKMGQRGELPGSSRGHRARCAARPPAPLTGSG